MQFRHAVRRIGDALCYRDPESRRLRVLGMGRAAMAVRCRWMK